MNFLKIKLPFKAKKKILALGAQTKNTVCFIEKEFAYLSKIHSDLSQPQDFLNFKKTVNFLLKKNPKIIAHDLHLEYTSTKYALGLSKEKYSLKAIQHHHAHIVSAMIDNGLKDQKVLGVAFDGTGLGEDNTLWGSEFLICDYKNFKRKAFLKPIPLLGAEKAILEPWRLVVAWLYSLYKDNFLNLKIDFLKKINKRKWQILKKMYLAQFNSPLSSSMGRFFDAIASLVLKKYKINFEAELPIALEKIACSSRPINKGYPFKIIKNKKNYFILSQFIFKKTILDLNNQVPKEEIAYKFHFTIALMVKKVCQLLRKEYNLNKVVLSGGVFQNKLLVNLTLDLLYKEGFKVFTHKNLSSSDMGISLGQAVIAH